MRLIYCAAGMLLAGFAAGGAEPPPSAGVAPEAKVSETIRLFDGKDLGGWEGHKSFWSAEGGEIVGRNSEGVGVSTYLLTKRTFSDFRLVAKVKRVRSGMHSGIAFWGRTAPEHGDPYTYAGHLVMFPSPWGMFDLYGRKLLPVDPAPAVRVGKPRDWNSLEILARRPRVRVALNGTQVVDWTDPEPDRIKVGPIGLQLHANNVAQEVRFKDLILVTNPKVDRLVTIGR